MRPEGRERNHFGIYTCADGRVFEGSNVDNHFDPFNLQVTATTTTPPLLSDPLSPAPSASRTPPRPI